MKRTWCFRLYPNRSQERTLLEMADRCRELYNMDIAYRRAYYEYIGRHTKTHVSAQFPLSKDTTDHGLICARDQWNSQNFLQKIRNENEEYKIVPGRAINMICRDIDAQYSATFSKRKKGDVNAWFPGFRKRHVVIIPLDFRKPSGNAKTYYDETDGRFSRLVVKNVGPIKVRSHRKLPVGAKICEVEIIRKDHWYVYMSLDYEATECAKPWDGPVGIDLGIRTTIALSDGTEFNKPYSEDSDSKRLAGHQRKLSKQVRGSKRYGKTKKKIRNLYERNTRRRDHWWHVVTRRLADRYGKVFYEDLKLSFMNSGVSKSNRKKSHEIAFGKIKGFLAYKMGDRAVSVNPFNTSKMCCQCGGLHRELRDSKVYTCPNCGIVIDRDLNASINILKLGLFGEFKSDSDRLQYMDFPYLCAVKRNLRGWGRTKKVSCVG